MIVSCPACRSQYRIDTSRLQGGRGKLRCARCETVFAVSSPEETPLAPPEAPSVSSASPPAPQAPPSAKREPEQQPVTGPGETLGRPRVDRRRVEGRREESLARASGQVASVLAAARSSGKSVVVMGVLPGPFRERAVSALARCGVRTIATDTGLDCLDAAKRARPGLVVASAYLPHLTGAEVFEQLRALPELATSRLLLHADEPRARRWPRASGRRQLADARVCDNTTVDELVEICRSLLDPTREHVAEELDEVALRRVIQVAAGDVAQYVQHARGLGSEQEQATFHADLEASRNWCVDRHRGHADRVRAIFDEELIKLFGGG